MTVRVVSAIGRENLGSADCVGAYRGSLRFHHQRFTAILFSAVCGQSQPVGDRLRHMPVKIVSELKLLNGKFCFVHFNKQLIVLIKAITTAGTAMPGPDRCR